MPIPERPSPPEASLKIDAIDSRYAVPLIRLKLHVRCINLSIHLRRFTPKRGGLLSKPKASNVNGSKSPLAHCFGRVKQAPERSFQPTRR